MADSIPPLSKSSSAFCAMWTATIRIHATFTALREQLKDAKRPAHYLAIPPVLFETVVRTSGRIELWTRGRVIVEKPFGHDLASAQELNQVLLSVFDEADIFRIDHYLGKRAVNNVLAFRFANTFVESFWNRNYIESVEITMAEDFGVQGRGGFYDQTGTIRDVVQNHLFQVLSNLAMEPPVAMDSESIRDEKVKVLKAIPPIEEKNLVRGQFRGYRDENGVAKDFADRNLRRGETGNQFLALERCAVLHSRRQVFADHLYRNCRQVSQASDRDSGQPVGRKPSAAAPESGDHDRHGNDELVPCSRGTRASNRLKWWPATLRARMKWTRTSACSERLWMGIVRCSRAKTTSKRHGALWNPS